MELYEHSNISVLGIKVLTTIELKSMVLAFFLEGFKNYFSFLTASQMFEDKKKR